MSLSRASLFQYAMLAVPLAFAGMPLYLHAPDFYATHHGLTLTTLGFILLLIRALDAVQDPFIGYWSDRLAHYRLPLQWGAMVVLAIGFLALFNPLPLLPVWLWFALSLLLTTTAFSILSINLAALGGLWSHDPEQQTRITTMREGFGLLGLILASVIPLLLQRNFSIEASYLYYALIMTLLLIMGAAIFTHWFRHYAVGVINKTTESPPSLCVLLRQHSRFYLIYSISALASAIPAVLILFFTRDRLEAESLSGVFLMIYFVAGIVAMPLWKHLAARHGAPKSWLMAMIVAVLSFAWAWLLNQGDVTAFGIICVLSGITLGAELALPPAILAALVAKDSSQSRITTQFSVLAFLSKASLALAAGGILPLLDLSGYQPSADNSEPALQALSLYYALLPCLLKIIAISLLINWRPKNYLKETRL